MSSSVAKPPERVVVLVVTRNENAVLSACLGSLRAQTLPHHVIVIDNASDDDTAELARKAEPRVEVIANADNLGFAGGNNVGLRAAQQRGFEFAMLLNADATLAPEALEELVAAADAHPRAAFVGPMVYHAGEPNVIQSAGALVTRDWHFSHRGRDDVDVGQFNATERVDWVNGCAMLARFAALSEFGLLDEDYFMYFEEVDWCLRAREEGWEVWFAPRARAWHAGAQRNAEPGRIVAYYMPRNELLLLRRHRAGLSVVARVGARHARTLLSYSLRPKWRHKRASRDRLAMALRDAALGKVGKCESA